MPDLMHVLLTFLQTRMRGSSCMFELHEAAKQTALTFSSIDVPPNYRGL